MSEGPELCVKCFGRLGLDWVVLPGGVRHEVCPGYPPPPRGADKEDTDE